MQQSIWNIKSMIAIKHIVSHIVDIVAHIHTRVRKGKYLKLPTSQQITNTKSQHCLQPNQQMSLNRTLLPLWHQGAKKGKGDANVAK